MLNALKASPTSVVEEDAGGGVEDPQMANLLTPFVQASEAGRYELAPAEELDPQAVVRAISFASGSVVRRVEFVSVNDRLPSVHELNTPTYFPEREELLMATMWITLSGSASGRMLTGLWVAKFTSLMGPVPAPLWHVTIDGHRKLIGTYFGLRGEGRNDLVGKFTALIELLPKAIPLGELKEEPGTWLVLVG